MLKHDLGRVLLRIDALQAGALAKNERPGLNHTDYAEAMALLAPDLVARILADLPPAGWSARKPMR